MDIVGHVHVGHQQIIVADRCHHAPALSSTMNGDELANPVAMTNARARALTPVFQILGRDADSGVRENYIAFADFKRPFHENVRLDLGVRADFHIRADHRIRTDAG